MNETWCATRPCGNADCVMMPRGCGRTMELSAKDLFVMEFHVTESNKRTDSVVMPCTQCECGAISLVEDVPSTVQVALPGIVKWYAARAN